MQLIVKITVYNAGVLNGNSITFVNRCEFLNSVKPFSNDGSTQVAAQDKRLLVLYSLLSLDTHPIATKI